MYGDGTSFRPESSMVGGGVSLTPPEYFPSPPPILSFPLAGNGFEESLHLSNSPMEEHPHGYNPSAEILNLFQFPAHDPSMSFAPPDTSVLYDPRLHLNPSPDAFQSPPLGYGGRGSFAAGTDGSLFGGVVEEGEGEFGGKLGDGILEFGCGNGGRGRKGNKGNKHFATEKQRRVQLNNKFDALGSLVPNLTKNDRASKVGDAIGYIKELLRTVSELKLLVDKKKCQSFRNKRHKTEDSSVAGNMDMESCTNMRPIGETDLSSYYGTNPPPLRSSWLHRKTKEAEVDVRIVEDEVTIKLVQRKKVNCLLYASKILDELQLDLHHVAGGHIGDHYSFLFSAKICEGSSVYASAIVNKLIEAVERQHAANGQPTSNF